MLLFSSVVFADEIDMLLDSIEKKSDLSQKTKLANSGVSFVWTRDDLNRMQITNLKQILKTMYPTGYDENRYGLVDPLSYQANQPFMSSTIRLYIDNQEITSGLYGSGIFLMGDSNIDWVDHVEIYTQNPTYEYATESTITLIKLYSKSVTKDEGSKIKVASGSYGKKYVDAYNAGYIKDWSYFVFGLADDEKREKYYSHNTQLSRDKIANAVIATLHKMNTNILLNAFTQERDGFASLSMDATPTKSKLNVKYLHIGIDSKIKNFSYLFTYSYAQTQSDFKDDIGLITSAQNKTHDMVFTAGVKYNYKKESNDLLMGLKYRAKKAKWDKASINGINLAASRDKNNQNIATLYIEDQYSFSSHSLLNTGIEYQRVTNQNSVQNDNLVEYRLSHTYTTEQWTFKTLYSHTLTTLEPYLIGSHTFLSTPSKYYKPSNVDTFVENILYQKGANSYEIIADYSFGDNYFLPLSDGKDQGKLANYSKTLKMSGVDLRYIREYNQYDKFFVRAGYREVQNTPFKFKNYKQYTGVVRNINSYQKYDIFNELVYDRNNISKENFYNYSLGVQYHYDDAITVALKGLNIFDDARKSDYYRINPTTFPPEQPLQASVIDREVLLSASWVF